MKKFSQLEDPPENGVVSDIKHIHGKKHSETMQNREYKSRKVKG